MFDQLLDTTKKRIQQLSSIAVDSLPGAQSLGLARKVAVSNTGKSIIGDLQDDAKDLIQDVKGAFKTSSNNLSRVESDQDRTLIDKGLRPFVETVRTGGEVFGAASEAAVKAFLPESAEVKVSNFIKNAADYVAADPTVQEAARTAVDKWSEVPSDVQKPLGSLGILAIGFMDIATRGGASRVRGSLLNTLRDTTDVKDVAELLEFTIDKPLPKSVAKKVAESDNIKEIEKLIGAAGDSKFNAQILTPEQQAARMTVRSIDPDMDPRSVAVVANKIIKNPERAPSIITDLRASKSGDTPAKPLNLAFSRQAAGIEDTAVKNINTSDITIDTSAAEEIINTDNVARIARDIVGGEEVPPVIVDANNRVIGNGDVFRAHQEVKSSTVPVIRREDVRPTKILAVQEQRRTAGLGDEFYGSIPKESKRTRAKTTSGRIARRVSKTVGDTLAPVSTRISNVSNKLGTSLRRFEFDSGRKTLQRTRQAESFLRKVSKIPKDVQYVYDLARKNGDTVKIKEINNKYNLSEEYNTVRNLLDEMHEEASGAGLDIGYIRDYAPRALNDTDGFLQYMRQSDNWPVVSKAIEAKQRDLKRPLTENEKAAVASSLFRGYGNESIALRRPGQAKERMIDVVDPEVNKFYKTSDEALVSYIRTMTDNIEARKFFGGELKLVESANKRAVQLKKSIELRNNKIKNLKDEINTLESLPARTKVEANKLVTRQKRLEDMEFVNDKLSFELGQVDQKIAQLASNTKIDDNIGSLIVKMMAEGEIDPNQEQLVADILRARFNYEPTNAALSVYKNAEYISTMGTFNSAITQIADLVMTLYRNGVYSSVAGAKRAAKNEVKRGVKAATGADVDLNKGITREDLGIERIAQEFVNPDFSSRAVDTVFKLTGLNSIDRFGKETLVNASVNKLKRRLTKEDPKAQVEMYEMFGDEYEQVIDDILNDRKSENVLFYAFNELSDFQPISLSEMPLHYLTKKNGRLLYMLKSYTIKLFDVYRRESFKEIAQGNVVKGTTNLLKLGALLTVGNATADEIKEHVRPGSREVDIPDRLMEGLLKAFGLNKYMGTQFQRDGLDQVLLDQIIPPTTILEAIGDIAKGDVTDAMKVLPFGEDLIANFLEDSRSDNKKEVQPLRINISR